MERLKQSIGSLALYFENSLREINEYQNPKSEQVASAINVIAGLSYRALSIISLIGDAPIIAKAQESIDNIEMEKKIYDENRGKWFWFRGKKSCEKSRFNISNSGNVIYGMLIGLLNDAIFEMMVNRKRNEYLSHQLSILIDQLTPGILPPAVKELEELEKEVIYQREKVGTFGSIKAPLRAFSDYALRLGLNETGVALLETLNRRIESSENEDLLSELDKKLVQDVISEVVTGIKADYLVSKRFAK